MSSKIKGKSQLIAKLKRLSKETSLPVRQVVAKSALKLEGDAKTLIAKGSRSGESYSRGGKSSVRSAPGEPPKSDRGTLVAFINSKVSPSGLEATMGTTLKSGRHLEFGTNRMEARPWLQPTFEKNKKSIVLNINNAVKKALRKVSK
tara:strand:+ start:755 stop:1195 length:441 start_codon:yes stop_codon:yes gene_type:complete